jgi:hypothetical protein
MTAQEIEQKLLQGPYHQWLGLKVTAAWRFSP